MPNIGRLIRQYIIDQLGYSPAKADALRHRYFDLYGTTMRGLVLHHNLDADHFLAYVHDFPLDGLLASDPALDAMLAGLSGEKVIFTNANRGHAERVLAKLQVRRRFSRIIDVTALGYISKPDPAAYQNCLALLNARPDECIFIEDSARNLAPAAALGMTTILVDGDQDTPADYRIENILQAGAVIESICRQRGCPP